MSRKGVKQVDIIYDMGKKQNSLQGKTTYLLHRFVTMQAVLGMSSVAERRSVIVLTGLYTTAAQQKFRKYQKIYEAIYGNGKMTE